MNPTVYAARIDGPGAAHLSLHTSYEGAVAALIHAGRALFRDRFDYVPEDLSPVTAARLRDFPLLVTAARLRKAQDRLLGGDWTARVDELAVELDGEDAAAPLPFSPEARELAAAEQHRRYLSRQAAERSE